MSASAKLNSTKKESLFADKTNYAQVIALYRSDQKSCKCPICVSYVSVQENPTEYVEKIFQVSRGPLSSF